MLTRSTKRNIPDHWRASDHAYLFDVPPNSTTLAELILFHHSRRFPLIILFWIVF